MNVYYTVLYMFTKLSNLAEYKAIWIFVIILRRALWTLLKLSKIKKYNIQLTSGVYFDHRLDLYKTNNNLINT